MKNKNFQHPINNFQGNQPHNFNLGNPRLNFQSGIGINYTDVSSGLNKNLPTSRNQILTDQEIVAGKNSYNLNNLDQPISPNEVSDFNNNIGGVPGLDLHRNINQIRTDGSTFIQPKEDNSNGPAWKIWKFTPCSKTCGGGL